MDLLGDIGTFDQLTSARAENAVLSEKVIELTRKVKELTVENAALLAEVEMYRREAALPGLSKLALGQERATWSFSAAANAMEEDAFIKSGNGVYCNDPCVTLSKPNGHSNPLCCALHPDDTLLATGGADCYLRLIRWGSALAPSPTAAEDAVNHSLNLRLDAPVICAAFTQQRMGTALPVVAAGCMDGSVRLACFGEGVDGAMGMGIQLLSHAPIKHRKYVKQLAWANHAPILASASADGSILLSKVNNMPNQETGELQLETLQTFHFNGPVEAMCFLDHGNALCCYERGTTYLSYFHLDDGCKQTKTTLNDVIGGFDDHVSFTVMDLVPSPGGGKYLAAATDTNRNIILQSGSPKQLRNLYGHKNDSYSQPKIGWSSNGQYLYGNTQDDTSICVWDISSSSIVKRLGQEPNSSGHTGQIRDIYSSRYSDTLATVSYDKTAKIWLPAMS